jgi:hypothetical protein
MERLDARRMWRALEVIHGMIYFAPEANEEFAAVGLEPDGRMGYFASRSAPMGAVSAEVVIATFYNFHPNLVRGVIPRAWSLASPADILAARHRAVGRTLTRMLSDDAPVDETLALARVATEACTVAGRPLYAGHASLPWPDEPRVALWHAISLLREFRGDGHVAALVTHDVGPLTALVMHAASGDVPAKTLRATREWPRDAWDAEVARLQGLGWVAPDGTLTGDGTAVRQSYEDRTDDLALAPWEHLGADGCARLRELGKTLSRQIVAAGALPGR